MNNPDDLSTNQAGLDENSRDIARENWERYLYGVTRGHRDYAATAATLEGYYLGGQYDGFGNLLPGGHWNTDDLEVLTEQGRPAYEFNQVASAINSAIGYQVSNRVDIAFRPRQGGATRELADVRSKVAMQIAANNDYQWVESEAFADGMIQQRGFIEARMDFEDSIFGELRLSSLDPIDVIPDPDAKSYLPAGWGDVIVTRWLTADEIEGRFGVDARLRVEASGSDVEQMDFGDGDMDTVARSKFGGLTGRYDAMHKGTGEIRYRIIDRQKRVTEMGRVAVHPGGDMRPLGGDETPESMADMHANGVKIINRRVRRVRWTVSTMDTVLHDDWSPYDRFTVIPFFPYFRRGKTRGMIDNAIGPQMAVNKGISQAIHIINSTANSGWQLEEDQLTNMTTRDLEDLGASTGLVLERKRGTQPLQKIQPNGMPPGIERLIDVAVMTLKDVTVPDAMRGTQGAEVSGIAIQSRQHAAQQALAVPLDNLARTRKAVASWIDYAISKYYDAHRVFRITRTDANTGSEVDDEIAINQLDPATGVYMNDMTVGEYDVVITEQPMQVTFENSQFTQALELRKVGVAIPDPVIVRYSNLSDKHEVAKQMAGTGAPPPDPLAEARARLMDAQTRKTQAEAVNKSVEGMFSATEAAKNIALNPGVSQLADMMMRSGGFIDADASPVIPDAPPGAAVVPSPENTNPLTPINPATGVNDGIEGGGNTGRDGNIQSS